MAGRILVVDDEEDLLEVCRDALVRTGAGVETERDPRRAARRLCSESFDVALLDVRMPELTGIEMLEAIRTSSPRTSVILMTAFPTPETVERGVRLGAEGYITKPFTRDQIVSTVTRVLTRKRLAETSVRPLPSPTEPFEGMIGSSPEMRAVVSLIEQVAPTNIDVMILGESGTGKELIARSIHKRSPRALHRFVPLDCGAIPEDLMESELFGHEKGSFTGAITKSIGLMEFANQGVLFLDEICELAPELQAKLLRSLQERQIRRVGGSDLIPLDIRVVAATNRDLSREVKAGRFREDLYYRLNAFRIDVPPLRLRRGDLPALFAHFLERAAEEAKRGILRAEPEVLEVLSAYRWPGNVRELQNVARRVAVVAKDGVVRKADLPPEVVEAASGPSTGFFSERSIRMREFERDYLTELLEKYKGDVPAAAAEANLPRGTVYRLMKKHGLTAEAFRR